MKNTFSLVLLLSFISCYKTEQNCKNFKTGKFKFDYEVNGVKKVAFFERNDSLEIETFEGKTDTSSIRWINNCECVLRKKYPKNNQEKNAISLKILTTSKDSYTFEFGMVGVDFKQRGTATKIGEISSK